MDHEYVDVVKAMELLSKEEHRFLFCATYDRVMEFEKWQKKIPSISFPAGWRVQVLPPFVGAVARFRVFSPDGDDKNHISVYLDCYEHLGCFGEPYWEAYPIEGDTYRCRMDDTQELIDEMKQEFQRRKDK